MSILDFLFDKAKKSEQVSIVNEPTASIGTVTDTTKEDEELFEIPDLGIFVGFERSPLGEWVICWRDANDEGASGYRDSGKGIYVLYNSVENRVVLPSKLDKCQ